MKFLIDVCAASRSLHTLLVDLDHDVVSARDGLSHATDEELLALAYDQQRVLVTEDKDSANWSLCAACSIRALFASLRCGL